MKNLELMVLLELAKNSRNSDRELAKAVGVSQPTITRKKQRLEEEGILEYCPTLSARSLKNFVLSDQMLNDESGLWRGYHMMDKIAGTYFYVHTAQVVDRNLLNTPTDHGLAMKEIVIAIAICVIGIIMTTALFLDRKQKKVGSGDKIKTSLPIFAFLFSFSKNSVCKIECILI